jgi:hypothetical protein
MPVRSTSRMASIALNKQSLNGCYTRAMSQVINSKLPNPHSSTDPQWGEWDNFLIAHRVQTCNEPVVRRYQCLDDKPYDLLPDDRLNHLLTLQAEGGNSAYADDAEDHYGRDFDPDERIALDNTLSAFDAVFSATGYRFSKDSTVFKGIRTKPYYTMHQFESIAVGDTVMFQGFLSTSVCLEKGEAFTGPHGVLLVITGLDKVDCIIPENKQVINTPNAHIPEQEVLLNRGTKMVVRNVLPGNGMPNKKVLLEVI